MDNFVSFSENNLFNLLNFPLPYASQGEIVHEDVYEERQVIEPEVLEHLPSVRKLAELYKQEGSSEISNSTNNNTVVRDLLDLSYIFHIVQFNFRNHKFQGMV